MTGRRRPVVPATPKVYSYGGITEGDGVTITLDGTGVTLSGYVKAVIDDGEGDGPLFTIEVDE